MKSKVEEMIWSHWDIFYCISALEPCLGRVSAEIPKKPNTKPFPTAKQELPSISSAKIFQVPISLPLPPIEPLFPFYLLSFQVNLRITSLK